MNNSCFVRLYGRPQNPIYVYAPAYLEESAGIRALHFLCHALNQSGNSAWLVIHGVWKKGQKLTNPNLNTPILYEYERNLHFDENLTPIVVYPETIPGNPLNAPIVVRWLLNYPGVLGGPVKFSDSEYLLAYSKEIANSSNLESEIPVLFLPTIDFREILEFREKHSKENKDSKALVYAGKYRGFVGNPILPRWYKGESLEIWREGKNKQSREDVLKLISESSLLFAFENSSIITESVLLGTPVILVKSTFFDNLIAKYELGMDGCAWSDELNPIENAQKNLPEAEKKYIEAVNVFFQELDSQVLMWRRKSENSEYLAPINLPDPNHTISRHRINLAFQVYRTQGMITLLRVIKSFIRRRLS